MKYQYFINFNKASPSWSEFWPTEEAICTKSMTAGESFYREKCSELIINRKLGDKDNSTVYDALETWFTDKTKFDTEIEVEIYRGDRSGTLYFAGYFSISDSKINKEYRVFKITPLIDDDYRDFIDGKDAKIDVRATLIGENIILGIPVTIGAWNAGSPSGGLADFDTFTTGANNGILTSVIDLDALTSEARYVSLGALAINDVVFVDVSAYNQTGAVHPLIDVVNAADGSITAGGAQTINATGIYSFTLTAGVAAYLMLYCSPVISTTNFSMTFTLDVSDGIKAGSGDLYMDFIERFITNALYMGLTGFVGKIKSTFFNNDALPSDAPSSIDTWITAHGSGNYVSEDTSNPLNGFIISETRRWVDDDVTEVQISFSELMSDLKEVFDVGWYIDADGDFRIEHSMYFEKLWDDSTAVDITGATYTGYKPETDAKELIFNKALLANREQFSWQQVDTVANSEDFVGVDIIYDDLETISNVITHEARNITTDIIYLNDNAADASASGFCYFQCYLDGANYVIEKEVGVLSTDDIRNNHFSWANLHDKYWTWRRMSENGDMNTGDTTSFNSAVKFLEQSNIKFGYATTLSGFTKITTSQGDGQQLEVKRDLDTDFVTILLGYNPYE